MINQVLKKHKKHLPLVLIIVFFIAEVIFFIIYHNTWFDEANYLYNGWAIYEYGWFPYQDVWTRITPLAFYIFGLPQYLFGPGLYIGRITATIFLFLSAWLMYAIAKKIGGQKAAYWSLIFLIFTPCLVRYYVSATPYSLVIFFVLASIWSLLKFESQKYQVIFSLFFVTLVVLVRQNLAPLLFVFFIYWLIIGQNKKIRILTLVTPALTAGIILSPFLIANFSNFLKDMVYVISPTQSRLLLAKQQTNSLFSELYMMLRKNINFFSEFYGLILLYLLILLGVIKKEVRGYLNSIFSKNHLQIIYLLIFSFLTLYAVHYLIPGTFKFVLYSLYFLPLLILTTAIIFGKLWQILTNIWAKKVITITLVLVIVMGITTINYEKLYYDFPDSLAIAKTDIGRIKNGAKVLQRYFNKDDLVFILDESHLPLEAGLQIPPALSARYELFVSGALHEDEKTKYWNTDSIIAWFKEVDGAILQKGKWETYFERSEQALPTINLIKSLLTENCLLMDEVEGAFPERYLYQGGIAEIYLCNNKLTTFQK